MLMSEGRKFFRNFFKILDRREVKVSCGKKDKSEEEKLPFLFFTIAFE